MKIMLLKILKILLIGGLVVMGIVFAFALVLIIDLPWWAGFFVLFGIAGFVILLIFLKKIFQKKREQQFVEQVISEEAARTASLSDKDKERSRELQDRWKEAMDALRSSHLRKKGNPLYVLPWYLIIGESGSGKTTSIKSARLSSPFVEVNKTSGISGTRNCDWWFFEQAIILDTAGRYAIPVDEGRDKDEWQKFLTQLARFRKREPLNGLVITVAADKLMSASAEILEADGQSIRLRIDELMRVLGAKFPVYLLVTKCDLIQGMTNFCGGLPEAALDQAMGILNHELSIDILTYHEQAMHGMVERLKDLRLQLLNEPTVQKNEPSLFLFPEEFERLKTGLFAFMKGAFQENPYQETPILRGTFFSSGRQEGSPYSHFLKSLGLIGDHDVLPGTSKGMFLFDFFSKILPGDRGLFTPTIRAVQWNRLTRNLGLTAWAAILIALCGFLSFSFVKNLRTIRAITNQFGSPPVLTGDNVEDVREMDRFRQTILQAEKQNQNWWIPRFWLNESLEVVSRLKVGYDTQFREMLLSRMDREMNIRMAAFTPDTPDVTIGNHFSHLVRRINLLKGWLNGDDFETLQHRPQPGYEVFAPDSFPELRERFHGLYLYDVWWRQDRSSINQEMIELQNRLKRLLELKKNDLSFLVAWANADPDISGVSLDDFWKGAAGSEEEPVIPPAFTQAGKAKIDAFISNELKPALPDPLVLEGGELTFQKWYASSCLDKWQAFTEYFPNGRRRLIGRAEYQSTAKQIADGEGPYRSYLELVTEELAPYENTTDRGWVNLAFRFKEARQQAIAQKATGAAKDQLRRLAQRAKSKLHIRGNTNDITQSLTDKLADGGTALLIYEEALQNVSEKIINQKSAFEVASETFSNVEDSDLPSEGFLAANYALQELKASLLTGAEGENILEGIISGPQDILWEFVCKETACYLNEEWEDKVLLEIEGMSGREANALIRDKGLAEKIIDGDAAPFIDRSLGRGYHAKRVLGNTVPFEGSFFTYLSRAEQAAKQAAGASLDANYSVTIKGNPTGVNKRASYKPYETLLEVECSDNISKLVNRNFSVKETFEWSHGACKDTVLSIKIHTLVLTRRYKGDFGFPKFLQDFGNGKKRLTPSDFPDHRQDLEDIGVTYIDIDYVFSGHQALMNAYNKRAPTPSIPRTIAQCWE